MPRCLALGLALVLAIAGSAPAEPARVAGGLGPAEICERAIVNGARRGGVPVEVLHAVALTGDRQEAGRQAPRLALGDQHEGRSPLCVIHKYLVPHIR